MPITNRLSTDRFRPSLAASEAPPAAQTGPAPAPTTSAPAGAPTPASEQTVRDSRARAFHGTGTVGANASLAASAPTTSAPPTAGADAAVDPAVVDNAVLLAGTPPTSENLVAVLNTENITDGGPLFDRQERAAIVATLAKDERTRGAIAGLDRLDPAQQRDVAEAVDDAVRTDQLSGDDLIAIADAGGDLGGARLVETLATHATGREPGGSVDALGTALQTRADAGGAAAGADRAAAALAFTSSAALAGQKLDTSEKRASAFDAVTGLLDDLPASGVADPIADRLAKNGGERLGAFFVAHSQEIVDAFAQPPAQSEPLARFAAHVVLSPALEGVALDRDRDLVPAIHEAYAGARRTLLGRIESSGDEIERERAASALGALSASVSAGSARAVQVYNDEINGSDEARQTFGTGLAAFATKALSNAASGYVVSQLTTSIIDALEEDPEQPGPVVSQLLNQQAEQEVVDLQDRTRIPDVLGDYQAGYASELADLQQSLEVTLGARLA